MSTWDNSKKVASRAFDESIKVIKGEKNPIDAADAVKKHAEELEKKDKKK